MNNNDLDRKPTAEITHNTELQRFTTTLEKDGKLYTGYISYQHNSDGDTLIYDHTVVPKELGGRGIGSALVQHALDYAQKHDKKVVPQCSFVQYYINKHPEYQNLI